MEKLSTDMFNKGDIFANEKSLRLLSIIERRKLVWFGHRVRWKWSLQMVPPEGKGR